MNKASEAKLGELHGKVAQIMVRSLEQLERQQDAFDELSDESTLEVVRPEPSASLLSAMTKFLADNKITCDPDESAALGTLEQRLAKKRMRKQVGNVVPIRDED